MNRQKATAQTLLGSLISLCPTPRRLEDRIRRLCAEAVNTTDPVQLNPILEQLRLALHEQVERLRKLAGKHPIPPERRRIQL